MAKPGSSSGPRLQGTLLPVLLLLLLASSIQAGPVTASELEPFVGVFEKLTVTVLGKIKGLEGLKWGFRIDKYGHKAEAALMGKQNPGPAGGGTAHAIIHTVSVVTSSITGGTSYRGIFFVSTADITATAAVSTGFCAKQRVSVSPSSIRLFGGGRSVSLTPFPVPGRLLECPVVAGGAPAWVALGLGRGGDLSRRFPRFSYTVTSYLNTLVDLSPPLPGRGISTSTPLFRNPRYPNDGRYYVGVAGIWVGPKVVWTIHGELSIRPNDGTGGVYLSTTDYYTVLERGVYGLLRKALVSQIKGATPAQLGPADRDRLCYNVNVGTKLTVPPMAIVFDSNKAVMELTGPNVWEAGSSPSTICLAIRPALPGQASVLGSRLQSGRTMTVDLTAGAGTLTFCGPASCVHA